MRKRMTPNREWVACRGKGRHCADVVPRILWFCRLGQDSDLCMTALHQAWFQLRHALRGAQYGDSQAWCADPCVH